MGSSKKSKKRKRSNTVALQPDDETTFAVGKLAVFLDKFEQNHSYESSEVILKARVAEDAPTKSQDEHWVSFRDVAGVNGDLYGSPRTTMSR
jgi:hypothetical protein